MKSWIESANKKDCPFPIQNLPYGVFRLPDDLAHCCVAIGEEILDLTLIERAGLLDLHAEPIFDGGSMNKFISLGRPYWTRLRERLTSLLVYDGASDLRSAESLRSVTIRPQKDVRMILPITITEYTDFYAARNHALNSMAIMRGEHELPPNWLSMPVAYNGRASSVVVSGTDVTRPLGQMKIPDAELSVFGPSKKLDFELEVGAVIGSSSPMGKPITISQAEEMIFGFVLLNDWSARDIQAWEARPLGPFQSKAFATSISPWIVTQDALAPFKVSGPERLRPLLPYLEEPRPMHYDIHLEVSLETSDCSEGTVISRTNYKELYYSAPQMLTHHALSGCGMRIGDLLGSGTISGSSSDSLGCLLELSRGGAEQIELCSGRKRFFLEDGDLVKFSGFASNERYRIGFGECTGKILPAPRFEV